MITQLLVKGLLMTAYGVVLLISLGHAGLCALMVAMHGVWGIFDTPVDTAVFLGILFLTPFALLLGLAWVPKRPFLAGATLVGATLLSFGLDSVRSFGPVGEPMIAPVIWFATGLLGLTTMLLGSARRPPGSNQPAPADLVR